MLLTTMQSCAQLTVLDEDHRIVNIDDNGIGDYTRSLILLHEMYNGTIIPLNFASGTITELRGNRYVFTGVDYY